MKKITEIAMFTSLVLAGSGTAMADDGKDTYNLVCSSCHESGAKNAPKLEDKVEWISRIAQGMDTLYASTLDGKCQLYVKVLRKDLSDEVIKNAVDYMVYQIKQPSPFSN